MLSVFLRTILAGGLSAALLLAHYTWVTPEKPFEKGKTAAILIGHGHRFPATGEAIDARGLQLFVVNPAGARTLLTPRRDGARWVADYPVRDSGGHRIVLVQDLGIVSRTPEGVRPGDRDKNPSAIASFRTYRSAVSYTAAAPAKPLGLELELLAEPAGGGWQLQLLRSGAPAPGVLLELLAPGMDAVKIGKTGADGRLTYRPAAPGPVAFHAEWSVPPPAGARYDSVNLSTSVTVPAAR